MEPVELAAGRLLLRAPTPADVPRIVQACQDPDTQRWTTVPVPYGRADAVAFVEDYAARGWARGDLAVFAITAAGDPDFLGAIDLTFDGRGAAEAGFAVAPWARGRGVATAALRAVCRWGFEILDLGRVEWQAQVGNVASRRVAERVGFTVEGTCRARLVQRGRRYDGWIGGLLPGDLR